MFSMQLIDFTIYGEEVEEIASNKWNLYKWNLY